MYFYFAPIDPRADYPEVLAIALQRAPLPWRQRPFEIFEIPPLVLKHGSGCLMTTE
jgi:hypothetical protein